MKGCFGNGLSETQRFIYSVVSSEFAFVQALSAR
jgi:hypothetical protein